MKLALAGDTMLGRKVAERLVVDPPGVLFSKEVVAVAHEAALFILESRERDLDHIASLSPCCRTLVESTNS